MTIVLRLGFKYLRERKVAQRKAAEREISAVAVRIIASNKAKTNINRSCSSSENSGVRLQRTNSFELSE